MDKLKANILMDNNILYITKFSIKFSTVSAYIHSYDVKIIISARYYFEFLKHKILANDSILVLI